MSLRNFFFVTIIELKTLCLLCRHYSAELFLSSYDLYSSLEELYSILMFFLECTLKILIVPSSICAYSRNDGLWKSPLEFTLTVSGWLHDAVNTKDIFFFPKCDEILPLLGLANFQTDWYLLNGFICPE